METNGELVPVTLGTIRSDGGDPQQRKGSFQLTVDTVSKQDRELVESSLEPLEIWKFPSDAPGPSVCPILLFKSALEIIKQSYSFFFLQNALIHSSSVCVCVCVCVSVCVCVCVCVCVYARALTFSVFELCRALGGPI
jgi:hypothetical protein